MYDQDSNSAEHRRRSQKGAIVPVAVAMVGAVVLAMLVYWQRSQGMPRNSFQFDTLANPNGAYEFDDGTGSRPEMPRRRRWPYDDAFRAQSVEDLLQLLPDDQPLTAEPAGLAALPGSTRVAGFRRGQTGVIEEVAFYETEPIALEEVWSHFSAAAEQAGYVQVRPSTDGGPYSRRGMRSRAYAVAGPDGTPDPSRRDHMLIVRVTPSPADAPDDPTSFDTTTPRPQRIMVWLRYADTPVMTQPDQPPAPAGPEQP